MPLYEVIKYLYVHRKEASTFFGLNGKPQCSLAKPQTIQDRNVSQGPNVIALYSESQDSLNQIKLTSKMISPKITLGNLPNENNQLFPPFYITLELQGLHLHNGLYDSRASHSLMTLEIMEKLVLDIIRPYKYQFYFNFKTFKCLGMIKCLVVGMVQIPRKIIIMYVVISNSPPHLWDVIIQTLEQFSRGEYPI